MHPSSSSNDEARLTWGAHELAFHLGVKVKTVWNRHTRNPELLPPHILYASGERAWLPSTVKQWLEDQQVRRRGRPPKRESIAKAERSRVALAGGRVA